MVYLLLFVGLVFSISIGAFLWGKLDPEVKAANAEYEKSLANLKIEDDTTAGISSESPHKENNKSIRDESDSFNQKKKTDLSLQKNLTNFNDTRNYFKISKNWYGQGMIIKVKFNRGIHQDYSFIYNHDEVYDNTINHLRTLMCWKNDNSYSSATSIPSWAKLYIYE